MGPIVSQIGTASVQVVQQILQSPHTRYMCVKATEAIIKNLKQRISIVS